MTSSESKFNHEHIEEDDNSSHNIELITDLDWNDILTFCKPYDHSPPYIKATKGGHIPWFQISKLGSTENLLKAPYGVSKPYGGRKGRSSIELEIENQTVIDSLRALDDTIITTAFHNKWFGDLSMDELSEMYTPIWKKPTYERVRGSMRVKVAEGHEAPLVLKSSYWDSDTKEITAHVSTLENSVYSRCRLEPILGLSPDVWHSPKINKFGVTIVIRAIITFDDPSMQMDGGCEFEL